MNNAVVGKGISGSTIKIIAIVTMLIDHIGAVILERFLAVQMNSGGLINGDLYMADLALRLVGRLGFPIFCFLLVEGFQRTKNLKKYLMRLGLFALISEIPFNLAIGGSVLDKGHQSVYFTLLLGMLALWGIRTIEQQEEGTKPWIKASLTAGGFATAGVYLWLILNNLMRRSFAGQGTEALVMTAVQSLAPIAIILCILAMQWKNLWKFIGELGIISLLMLLADNLRTDYGGIGVAVIVIMYLVRENRMKSFFWGTLALCITQYIEAPALLALVPISKYNGERGLKLKYFFYAFYPVHLFLLWLIALALGVGFVPVG